MPFRRFFVPSLNSVIDAWPACSGSFFVVSCEGGRVSDSVVKYSEIIKHR